MAFGATGASGQFKFLQEDVTLSDAVGKAGGLLDSRAEPGQVFVYRIEQRSTLEKMGVDVSNFAEDREDDPDDLPRQFPRSVRLLCGATFPDAG